MVLSSFQFIGVTALTLPSVITAHGVMAKPAPKYPNFYAGNWRALIDGDALTPPAGKTFNNWPNIDQNAAVIAEAFKSSQYESLKDFIMDKQDLSRVYEGMPSPPDPKCGWSQPNDQPQELPDKVIWETGPTDHQFNHPGPCEIWCDDTLALPYTDNCRESFPNGEVTYDKAACEGKSELVIYWLAVHMPPWQVYGDCANLAGAKVGGEADAEDSNATMPAPPANQGGDANQAEGGNQGGNGGDYGPPAGNDAPTTGGDDATANGGDDAMATGGDDAKPVGCKAKRS